MSEFNVELYTPIGEGRESSEYQKTIVYKGRIKRSIEFVAVKMIDIQRLPEVTRGFEFQRQANHRNIIEFFSWCQTTSKLYVTVEYCPGGTLSELLEKDVCIPESVLRIFASDILAALACTHKAGYLYRDFSPRNILLDECGILKLSDFTHCGKVDEPLDAGIIDIEMLEYMAPELLSQSGIPSYASDLYGLGCLMYQLASGVTPFAASEPDQLITLIKTSRPETLPDMSDEFNDIVMKLLVKNPYERLTWNEVLSHPFWKDALSDRIDDDFADFDQMMLPHERVFEQNRGSVKFGKSMSSASIATSIRVSQNLVSKQQVMEEEMPVSQEKEMPAISVIDLISDSEFFKPEPVVFNTNIENYPLPSYEGCSLPVTQAMLKTSNPEELDRALKKVHDALNGPDSWKPKAVLLSFLISQSMKTDVANNFINSSIFPGLLTLATTTKHPSLAAGFLWLYGSIVRHATIITAEEIPSDDFAPLEVLSASPAEKVARKAVAAIGQIVSHFVAWRRTDYPAFAGSVLMKALRAPDVPIRHYALRAVANIADTSAFSEIFDTEQIEQQLLDFDIGQSPFLLETYAAALASFYKYNKPTFTDYLVTVSKNLLTRSSPVSKTLGMILAAETGVLPIVKCNILSIFNTASGELKLKALMCLSIIYENSPEEFVEIAPKFFQVLEGVQLDSPAAFEVLISWCSSICVAIVDRVLDGADCDLLQVVYSAIQIRQLCSILWTPKFEKTMRKIIRKETFSTAKSEVAVHIVQCALCYQCCDSSVIVDLCRPLKSLHATVRFAVVKLVADAASQRPIPNSVMQFAESNVMSQLPSLLRDEPVIIDQALRIAANVCAENSELIGSVARGNTMELVFNSIEHNSFALQLAIQLISSGLVGIDALINARLVPSVRYAMDKTDDMENGIELLHATLSTIEVHYAEIKQPAAKRSFMRSINNLATMASKAAALLSYDKGADSLCIMMRIFTPQGKDNEVPLESSFNSIASAVSRICDKPEHAPKLVKVINTIKWSAAKSPVQRLKLKGCTKLTQALKKAVDYGTDELRAAAMECQTTIRSG